MSKLTPSVNAKCNPILTDAQLQAEFDKFWTEIIKDNPDETVLQAFVQNAPGPKRRQRFVGHMRGLMKILRPEQRERAATLFKRHPPWMRRGKPRGHEQ